MSMPSNFSESQRRRTSLPPKRGMVKAQIFKSFADTVKSVAFKAGRAMRGDGGDDSGSSASTAPPSSGYNTDG